LVGVLDIESRLPGKFDQFDEPLLTAVANQLAGAISNARTYTQLLLGKKNLQALHNAAKAITASVDREETLDRILEQALKIAEGYFASIQERDGDFLRLVRVYPHEMDEMLNKNQKRLMPLDGPGVTVRAYNTGDPQYVSDIKQVDYFSGFLESRTVSELAVPIYKGEQIRGVLNVEYDDSSKVTAEDLENLCALASLAGSALHNADQATRLADERYKATKRLMLDYSNNINNALLHNVIDQVSFISNRLNNIKKELERNRHKFLERELSKAQQYTKNLLTELRDRWKLVEEVPVVDLPVKTMLESRLKEWRKQYTTFSIEGHVKISETTSVRARPTELLQTFDLLVHNAAKALEKQSSENKTPSLEINCLVTDRRMLISFSDNGPGIPPKILPQLGKNIISKESNDSGSGSGCLIAQMVVEGMEGEIKWRNLSSGGACVSLYLPISPKE
jgi:GAF domain-containing protein